MCIYSDISKRIGWNSGRIMIPDLEVVKILYREVQDGDTEAFENIFRFHRFCEPPKTAKEAETIDLIYNAYQIGTKMFRD